MQPWLRNLFTGIGFDQEYLCLAESSFGRPFGLFLKDKKETSDVSKTHILLGYSPVLIAIGLDSFENTDPPPATTLDLVYLPTREKVAMLNLEMIPIRPADDLVLYRACSARHSFTNFLQHSLQRILDEKKHSKPGNVFLGTSTYDAIRIAYALPRRIALVCVSDGSLFNLFPTDLHGRTGNRYVDSLRTEGLAASQVLSTRRAVVCHVHAGAFSTAYALGKNHMRELRTRNQFPFSERTSAEFGFPLPPFTLGYDELKLESHIDEGIHRLFTFRIIHSEEVQDSSTLAHVHASPASFLRRQNWAVNYLLRETESPVKSGS